MKVKTQGYAVDGTDGMWLHVDPVSCCGSIDDGVGFTHGFEGGWVVALKDLERIVEEAQKARGAR